MGLEKNLDVLGVEDGRMRGRRGEMRLVSLRGGWKYKMRFKKKVDMKKGWCKEK
jgi:hypothetical protein